MKIQVLLVVACLSYGLCYKSNRPAMKSKFFWGHLDFYFPNASASNLALATRSYIPENNIISGIGVWRDKLFVSLFRYKVGVLSSLNYFSINSGAKSPLLIPFPSYDANYVNEDPQQKTLTLPSKSSIICAGHFRIDKLDRIWVLDAGFVDYTGKRRKLAPPALVIIDLKFNQLLRRYKIPAIFVKPNSVLINLDLDFSGKQCDVFAYMVDQFRSIIVYSWKKNRSWRLEHDLFGAHPNAGKFYFQGKAIQMNLGLMGITVGEHQTDGSKRVYLSAFASHKAYYISNKVLQNEAYVKLNKYFCDVFILGNRGKYGQISTWAYDKKTHVLFDTEFYRRRISCWNTGHPYRNSSLDVVYKSDPKFFPADIIVDYKRNLWVLSNSLFKFLFGYWNPNMKNIEIFRGNVDNIINGTCCTLPKAKYSIPGREICGCEGQHYENIE